MDNQPRYWYLNIFDKPFCKLASIEIIKMFFCWIKMFKNTFFISAPKNAYPSTNISILRGLEAVILTGTMVQLRWSHWNVFFCWIDVFEFFLISISRPTNENVYLD